MASKKVEPSSLEIATSSQRIMSTRAEWTTRRTPHPDFEHHVVVFVGERPHAESLEPLRRALSSFDVIYRGVTDVTTLPRARHQFFLLDELDHSAYGLLIDAVRDNATVTLIAQAIAPHLAPFIERPNVNVIPVCGDPGPISASTFERAIAMVLAGERVAARGFVQHSIAPHHPLADGSHPFVALLNEASFIANTSNTVVAAVLALQRTGSNFLHDMIGLSVSANVRTFHEHDVPGLADAATHPRPSFDRRLIDRHDRLALRQAVLRDTILSPERRYIFVTDRPPEDRLFSYFVKGRSAWLRRQFDASTGRFRHVTELQRGFDEWARAQLDRQRKWYRNKLRRPFGLDVLRTEHVHGLFIRREGANTLVVIPTMWLNLLSEIVTAAFRTDCYRALAYNSAGESGDGAMARAFREQFRLEPEVVQSLWAIPEVAHIHRSPASSIGAKHVRWIDAHGAQRGHLTRDDRHDREHGRSGDVRERIGRTDAE